MNNIRLFYYDRFGREVAYVCKDHELDKFIHEFLENHLDKGNKLYYTYKNDTKEMDYYNFNLKDL